MPVTTPFAVPLVDVRSTLECLLTLQVGVMLAIATLEQVGSFGAPTVLDGVADIFAALAAGTNTTVGSD